MFRKLTLTVAVVLLLAVGLGGCAGPTLIEASYSGVDQMLCVASKSMPKDSRVLVASFVNIDSLYNSSTLGRELAEFSASRLSQRGYEVVSAKIRKDSIVINPTGEFLLSREMKELANGYKADALLVGTYARTDRSLYVTLRLIRANDNTIMAAYDYMVPIISRIKTVKTKDTSGASDREIVTQVKYYTRAGADIEALLPR